MNIQPAILDQLNAQQLRELALGLMTQLDQREQDLQHKEQDIQFKAARITQLSHEIAILRRHRFGQKSEQFSGAQAHLFEEALDADLEAIERELQALQPEPAPRKPSAQPKRQILPAHLPRIEYRHEPDSTQCACGCQLKRIRQDVSEKLDYQPGTFRVERHVRGVWVCPGCETMSQAPMPAHIIDKGLAAVGLMVHILISKYCDHLPLYRLESRFTREGMHVPRSSMAQWVGQCGHALQPLVDALQRCVLGHGVLHADETPVRVLDPGQGKTKKAYLWAYAPGKFESLKAVVYEFHESRAGEFARQFLGDWKGKLVVDDYSGYKASFRQGITEVGCMAHARRKFFDLCTASKSPVAERAVQLIGELYEIERQALTLSAQQRYRLRQEKAKPLVDKLHEWMLAQRQRVLSGTATAKALDYSLKRWVALTRYLDDGQLPIDNNHLEQQIRPIAIGRANWLFAGSLRAGKRAAAVMSLIQSAKLNGLNPYDYLRDVLQRLPTHLNSRIDELLPHNWKPLTITETDPVAQKIPA